MNSNESPRSFFETEALADLGRRNRGRYAAAAPSHHIVLDDFFPESLPDSVLAGVEEPATRWESKRVENSIKGW